LNALTVSDMIARSAAISVVATRDGGQRVASSGKISIGAPEA